MMLDERTPSRGPSSLVLNGKPAPQSFARRELLGLGILYLVVLFAALRGGNVWVSVALFASAYCVWVALDRRGAFLFPCMIFPFMFLIRTPDPNAIVLAIIPDLSIIGAIVSLGMGISARRGRLVRKNVLLMVVLLVHIMLSFGMIMFHLLDVGFVPIVVRTYVLPLSFTVVLVVASARDTVLPRLCMRWFVLSLSIVAGIALLQVFSRFSQTRCSFSPHSLPVEFGVGCCSSKRERFRILG